MIIKNLAKKFLFFSVAVLASFSIISAVTPALPANYGGSTVYAQDSDEEEEDAPSCERDGGGQEFTWLLCPVLELIDQIVTWMDNLINGLLEVPESYFTDDLYDTWGRMRNVAYIILVPITLVMVISTALGFDFISAYTLKRALPRLIAAVVFIALSYALCTFAIQAINVIGRGILGLLTSSVGGPDQSLDDLFNPRNIDGLTWSAGLLFGGAAAATTALATGSIGVVLSLALVAMIGFFLGVLALVGRQLLLIALVLISPLAILAWIFPGNDKLWKLWWGTFSKLLLLYPLIMLLLGSGRALAFVVDDSGATGLATTLIKFIAYVGPFFFIPATFKLAGALFATLTSVGRDKARGFFDSQRKYRAERRQKTAQDTLEEKNRRGQNKFVGGIYRRRKMGGFGLTKQSQANYQGRVQDMRAQVAAKQLERDHGRAAGDDDANALLQEDGMTGAKFRQRYAAALRAKDPEMTAEAADTAARQALATAEASYGAKVGTAAMQQTAYKAQMTSVTGYSPTGSEKERAAYISQRMAEGKSEEEATNMADKHFVDKMYQKIEEDSDRMIANGYMTAADTVATQKANTKRADISALSFGTTLQQRFKSSRAYASGTRNPEELISSDEVTKLQDTILDGATAGVMLAQRPESVKALVPAMRARLDLRTQEMESAQKATRDAMAAGVGEGQVHATVEAKQEAVRVAQAAEDTATRNWSQEVASVSAKADIAGQISQQNFKPLAEGVMSRQVGSTGLTATQLVEVFRGQRAMPKKADGTDMFTPQQIQHWLDTHREYSSALNSQIAAAARDASDPSRSPGVDPSRPPGSFS